MVLHVINKMTTSLWRDCVATLNAGDALLLTEDAVFAAVQGHEHQHFLQQLQCLPRVYALVEDLAARGISARISPAFVSITYGDFVALSLEHTKVVNWQ